MKQGGQTQVNIHDVCKQKPEFIFPRHSILQAKTDSQDLQKRQMRLATVIPIHHDYRLSLRSAPPMKEREGRKLNQEPPI